MEIDIVEQRIKDLSPALLKILLSDKTTKKSIRWGTDNYNEYGTEYYTDQEITPDLITGDMTVTIQPRVAKSEAEQNRRTRDKAEVDLCQYFGHKKLKGYADFFNSSSSFCCGVI